MAAYVASLKTSTEFAVIVNSVTFFDSSFFCLIEFKQLCKYDL